MKQNFLIAVLLSLAASAATAADAPGAKPAAAKAAAAPAAKSGAAQAEVVSAPKLSMEQVVERNVTARGGLAAWRAMNAMTLTGDMDAGGKQNTALPFTMILKRPNLSRLELKFQEQTAVQVFDGKQGWKFRPFLGRNEVESYTPAELKSAAAATDLDAPLINYAARGAKVELQGVEAVEGKAAYKLKLTRKTGEQVSVWVDAASFLDVKMDGEPRRMDGRVRKVAVYYRDFKKVSGLTLPHLTETVVDGVPGSHKMVVKTAAVNPPLEASLFAKPQAAVAKASAK